MIARRWFQFRLLTLLGLMTAAAIGLACWPTLRLYWLVETISNDQVCVDGTTLGLMVQFDTRAAQQVRSYGPRANPALIVALNDPDRFAAAHVLLTEINCREYSLNGGKWNELEIALYGDGRIDFHPEQIPHLQGYWKARLGKR